MLLHDAVEKQRDTTTKLQDEIDKLDKKIKPTQDDRDKAPAGSDERKLLEKMLTSRMEQKAALIERQGKSRR